MGTPMNNPLSDQPNYFMAALAACVGIVIGSLAPWLTLVTIDRNATDGDGVFTLALGGFAALVLLVIQNSARKGAARNALRGCWLVIAAGVVVFAIGAYDAVEVLSRKATMFGVTISAQIGWGLWLVLVASMALTGAAVMVRRQIQSMADVPPMPLPFDPPMPR
jgi:hypothetical protein